MEANRLVKCYHVSHVVNRKSIKEKGLLTSDNDFLKYKNRLCFSVNEKFVGLDYVGYQNVDVWSFFISEDKMKLDELADANCFMYIEESISPENIVLEYTIH
jgi:hypothetical protein